MKILAYLTYIIVLLLPATISAQTVVLSRHATGLAGGQLTSQPDNRKTSLKVWYIAGQPSPVNRLSGINHELSQGFQQPISRILKPIAPIKVTAFPNPSRGLFQITIQDKLIKPITMKCLTLTGNIALEMKIKTSTTPLDLRHLAIGVYTIQFYADRKKYETLKIILK